MATTPLLLSPSRMLKNISLFLQRNARVSDTGLVYLIRIYTTILVTLAVIIIAAIHCVYSFIVPFIFRMNHIDATNWTLRFQLITVQLASFPLWFDSWWSLFRLRDMHVDGASVTQL